jgi:hypothetical protein
MGIGVVAATAGAFLLTALVTLCYRFPAPFAGTVSGVSGICIALGAVLFMGVALGGFVVLALVGATAGAAGYAIANHRGKPRSAIPLTIALALSTDLSLVLFMATFETW